MAKRWWIIAVAALCACRTNRPTAAPSTVARVAMDIVVADASAQDRASTARVLSCAEALAPLAESATQENPPLFARASEDAAPAVRAACAAVERATAARIDGLRRRDRRFTIDDEHAKLGRCHPAGRGAWLLDIDDWELLTFASCDPDQRSDRRWSYAVRYRLAYIAPDGRTIREQGGPREVYRRECDRTWASVGLTFDYDGDGVAEILLSSVQAGTGRTEFSAELLTVRGAAIARYGGLGESLASGARVLDADGDRRPDLVVAGPYVGECEGAEFRPRYACGVSSLLHSRTDGSFARADTVARAWASWQCQSRSASTALASDCDGLSVDVACARLFGKSPADVRAMLRAAAQGSAAAEMLEGDELERFSSLARTEPPFVIPRCVREAVDGGASAE